MVLVVKVQMMGKWAYQDMKMGMKQVLGKGLSDDESHDKRGIMEEDKHSLRLSMVHDLTMQKNGCY